MIITEKQLISTIENLKDIESSKINATLNSDEAVNEILRNLNKYLNNHPIYSGKEKEVDAWNFLRDHPDKIISLLIKANNELNVDEVVIAEEDLPMDEKKETKYSKDWIFDGV